MLKNKVIVPIFFIYSYFVKNKMEKCILMILINQNAIPG